MFVRNVVQITTILFTNNYINQTEKPRRWSAVEVREMGGAAAILSSLGHQYLT